MEVLLIHCKGDIVDRQNIFIRCDLIQLEIQQTHIQTSSFHITSLLNCLYSMQNGVDSLKNIY